MILLPSSWTTSDLTGKSLEGKRVPSEKWLNKRVHGHQCPSSITACNALERVVGSRWVSLPTNQMGTRISSGRIKPGSCVCPGGTRGVWLWSALPVGRSFGKSFGRLLSAYYVLATATKSIDWTGNLMPCPPVGNYGGRGQPLITEPPLKSYSCHGP